MAEDVDAQLVAAPVEDAVEDRAVPASPVAEQALQRNTSANKYVGVDEKQEALLRADSGEKQADEGAADSGAPMPDPAPEAEAASPIRSPQQRLRRDSSMGGTSSKGTTPRASLSGNVAVQPAIITLPPHDPVSRSESAARRAALLLAREPSFDGRISASGAQTVLEARRLSENGSLGGGARALNGTLSIGRDRSFGSESGIRHQPHRRSADGTASIHLPDPGQGPGVQSFLPGNALSLKALKLRPQLAAILEHQHGAGAVGIAGTTWGASSTDGGPSSAEILPTVSGSASPASATRSLSRNHSMGSSLSRNHSMPTSPVRKPASRNPSFQQREAERPKDLVARLFWTHFKRLQRAEEERAKMEEEVGWAGLAEQRVCVSEACGGGIPG